jgi:hypothetical protein
MIAAINAARAPSRANCIGDQATEWVIVAAYVPGAKFGGTTIVIVGFHDAELTPVGTPVTTVVTPVRSDAGTAVATTALLWVITPAA